MHGSFRCFVARQLLSQIYVLSSVKFPDLKLRLCKENDKYEVCEMGGVRVDRMRYMRWGGN